MKLIINNLVRLMGLCLCVSVFGALTAYAQEAKIDISHLERFSEKADKVIDVTVDEALIKLALSAMSNKRTPEEAKLKELISGLKGVYVKRFQFADAGEFQDSDMEPIRAQLRTPAWSRIANVRSKREGSYDVYIMTEGSIIRGLVVLASEPKAMTVVNVVGPLDLSKLSELEGKFGIPRWELMTGPKMDDDSQEHQKPAEKKPPQPEAQPNNDQSKVVIKDATTEKRVEKKQPPKLIRNSEKPPKE